MPSSRFGRDHLPAHVGMLCRGFPGAGLHVEETTYRGDAVRVAAIDPDAASYWTIRQGNVVLSAEGDEYASVDLRLGTDHDLGGIQSDPVTVEYPRKLLELYQRCEHNLTRPLGEEPLERETRWYFAAKIPTLAVLPLAGVRLHAAFVRAFDPDGVRVLDDPDPTGTVPGAVEPDDPVEGEGDARDLFLDVLEDPDGAREDVTWGYEQDRVDR